MRTVITVALLVIVLAGCGAHGLIGELPRVDDPGEAAEIFVVRVSSFNAKVMKFKISFDGFELLGIGNGEYTRFLVPPGDHTVSVVTKEGIADKTTSINVMCEPTDKYYFLIEPGYRSAKISRIGEDDAQSRIAKSKYLEVDTRGS